MKNLSGFNFFKESFFITGRSCRTLQLRIRIGMGRVHPLVGSGQVQFSPCSVGRVRSHFLSDCTNGCAYATMLRLSSVTYVLWLNGASYRKTARRNK